MIASPAEMNKKLQFLFLLLIICAFSIGCETPKDTTKALFCIQINHKTGYIDTRGNLIIPPKFLAAQDFSEGLAAARLNGSYGYIDETGQFIIPPQYDFATAFSEHIALVFKDGKPMYIDREGKQVFEMMFTNGYAFKNGLARIRTASGKDGYINKSGNLIIDTIYQRVNGFIDGLVVVKRKEIKKSKSRSFENNYAVLDSTGKEVVPFGKYYSINDFENGYFQIEIAPEPWDTIDGSTKRTGFLDKSGELLFSIDHKNNKNIDGNMHDGLAKIYLYKHWLPEAEGISFTTQHSYQGFINLKGEIVVNDTLFKYVNDFSDNYAFVQNTDHQYSIINTSGKIVAPNICSAIIGEGFKDGKVFINVEGNWGLLDTTMNFLINPSFDGIHECGIVDGYFFYEEKNENKKSASNILMGVAKTDGTRLTKAIMEDVDVSGFHNGLLKCSIHKKLTYINTQGKIIWQEEKSENEPLKNMNIDYMNRGYFYAASAPHKKGASRENGNYPVPLTIKLPSGKLSLIVYPDTKKDFYNKYKGCKMVVANTTGKKIDFHAQDGRLYMKVQALNNSGEWQDIEYLPSSWCGNSYHTVTLDNKEQWTFSVPVYEGEFKTKLRVELAFVDPADENPSDRRKKDLFIYSNEFEGSINPGQFWRKPDYFPNGLMDPYND